MHICSLEGRVILHTYLFYLSSLEHGQPGVLSMVASGMFWPAVRCAVRPPGTGRKGSLHLQQLSLESGTDHGWPDGRTEGRVLGWGPCLLGTRSAKG